MASTIRDDLGHAHGFSASAPCEGRPEVQPERFGLGEQGPDRSSIFFPHGLGHGIGLQVHDVGGFMKNARGETIPRPGGHPFPRQTRLLEPSMVCTIEPGLYFVDMLLAQLRERPEAKNVKWEKVDRFRRYGGIRIEDDVVCTDGDPENLTRDAFATLA